MPGPMSAPNGDQTVTVGTPFACQFHGTDRKKCAAERAQARKKDRQATCQPITKREHLLRTNRLHTGKTQL